MYTVNPALTYPEVRAFLLRYAKQAVKKHKQSDEATSQVARWASLYNVKARDLREILLEAKATRQYANSLVNDYSTVRDNPYAKQKFESNEWGIEYAADWVRARYKAKMMTPDQLDAQWRGHFSSAVTVGQKLKRSREEHHLELDLDHGSIHQNGRLL